MTTCTAPPRRCTARPALRSIEERNALVEANTGLVYGALLRLGLASLPNADDLAQAGMLGLIRAAELYDESKGWKFSTFADWWIRTRIERERQRQESLFNLPANVRGEERRELRRRLPARPLPGMATPADDCSRYSGAPADHRPGPGTAVEVREDLAALHRAVDGLPPRLALVLRRRYWEERTLDEVGQELDVTRERVRQLEKQALAKLARRLARAG